MDEGNVFTQRGDRVVLVLGRETGKIRGFSRGAYKSNPRSTVRALEPWAVSSDKLLVHDSLGKWRHEGATIGGLIYAEALSGSMAATATRNAERKGDVLASFASASLAELRDRQRRGVARYLDALDRQQYPGFREGIAEWKLMPETAREIARSKFISDMAAAAAAGSRTTRLDPDASWWLPADFADVYFAEIERHADAMPATDIWIPASHAASGGSWSTVSRDRVRILGLYFEYKAASEILAADPGSDMDFLNLVVTSYRKSMERRYAESEQDVDRLSSFLRSDMVGGDGAWYMSAMENVGDLQERLILLRDKVSARVDGRTLTDIERKKALLQWEVGRIVATSIVGAEEAAAVLSCSGADCQKRETMLRLAWHNYLEGFLGEQQNADILAKIDEIDALDAQELQERIRKTYVGQEYVDKDAIVLDLVAVLKQLERARREPADADAERMLDGLGKLRETFHGTGQEDVIDEAAKSVAEGGYAMAEKRITFLLHLYSVTVYLAPDTSGAATARSREQPILKYMKAKNTIKDAHHGASSFADTHTEAEAEAEGLIVPSETGRVPTAGVLETGASGVLLGALRYPSFSHFMVVASLACPSKGVFEDVVYPLVLNKHILDKKAFETTFWKMARWRRPFRNTVGALTERGLWKTSLLGDDNGLERASQSASEMGMYLVINNCFVDTASLHGLSSYLSSLRGLLLKSACQKIYGALLANMHVGTIGAQIAEKNIDVVFFNPGGDRFLGIDSSWSGDNVLGQLLGLMLVRIGTQSLSQTHGSYLYDMMADYPVMHQETLILTGSVLLSGGRGLLSVSSTGLRARSNAEMSLVATSLAFINGSRLRDSILQGGTVLALDRNMSYARLHLGYTVFSPFMYERLFSTNVRSMPPSTNADADAMISDTMMRVAGVRLEPEAVELLEDIRARYANWVAGVAYRAMRAPQSERRQQSPCPDADAVLRASMASLTELELESYVRDFLLQRIKGLTRSWDGMEHKQIRDIGTSVDAMRRNMGVFGFQIPLSRRAARSMSRMVGLRVLGSDSSIPSDTDFRAEWALVDSEAKPGEKEYGKRRMLGWKALPPAWRDRRLVSRAAAAVLAEILFEFRIMAETVATATEPLIDHATQQITTMALVGMMNVMAARNM